MGFSVRVCQYANLVQCLATMTTLAKIWKIQVTAIFLNQDMLGYLSADMYIICSGKRTVF